MNAHKVSHGNTVVRRRLRVLFVEDSPPDAFLLTRALEQGGFEVVPERIDTPADLSAALDRQSWDVILADHSMPQFSAPEALEMVKARNIDVPFIIVSGHIEEQTAVAAMNAGAHDYIMKDRLARLVPAVERELREATVRRAQKEYQEKLRRAHEELELRVEERTADLKAANEKLRQVLAERRRLENELLEIAENERRRIGFDLHDDLGQKLTGASLMIKGLEQRLLRENHTCIADACRIRELMEEITRHAHNLARQFSALDADGGDVVGVLKGLAAHVEKMFHIPCLFSVKGQLPPLPETVAVQFYKIAQEAISNAIKHGKASRVCLSVSRYTDRLVLAIKNDGVPFSPPADPKSRMGLRIMNYRANTVGALFEIKANNKTGALVTCTLPLKSSEPPASGSDREPIRDPGAPTRWKRFKTETVAA